MTIKKKEVDLGCTDVEVIIIKEWQHPAGTLKAIGSKLTVTSDYAELLVGEGYAEIKKNKK